MKIIIKDEVYIQIKDLKYLSAYYHKREYIEEYVNQINNKRIDTDFIKINNEQRKKDILYCDDILNIIEYNNYNFFTIQRLITTLSITNTLNSINLDKRIEELREIMDLKNGELTYAIPLIPDGRMETIDMALNLRIKSTIFDYYFIIESLDNGTINEEEAKAFINYTFIKNNIPKEYRLIPKDNTYIILVEKQKKRKKLTKKKDNS